MIVGYRHSISDGRSSIGSMIGTMFSDSYDFLSVEFLCNWSIPFQPKGNV